eukprot:TRINITY_DN23057_c0_g1_i1.p1 TRINITY_DN23057_c0_g1~~TRINITY_DN23057_c0_g1_i1.p1  ORF type:complete len:769 (-),score=135.48 TRINITY_DN23057_c0_g1_i1:21-2327(-)
MAEIASKESAKEAEESDQEEGSGQESSQASSDDGSESEGEDGAQLSDEKADEQRSEAGGSHSEDAHPDEEAAQSTRSPRSDAESPREEDQHQEEAAEAENMDAAEQALQDQPKEDEEEEEEEEDEHMTVTAQMYKRNTQRMSVRVVHVPPADTSRSAGSPGRSPHWSPGRSGRRASSRVAENTEEDEEEEQDEEEEAAWREQIEDERDRQRRCSCFFRLIRKCAPRRVARRTRPCRKRWGHRRDTICRPCDLLIRFIDRLWNKFEHSYRITSWVLKCLFCPLLLLLRCSLYCIACKRQEAPYHSPEEFLGIEVGHRHKEHDWHHSSSVLTVRTSTSSLSSGTGSNSSPHASASGAPRLNQRQKAPERSRLKRPRPRPRKAAAMSARGSTPKNATLVARQEFRENLKNPGKDEEGEEEDEAQHVPSILELGWYVWLPWNIHATYELWKKSRVKLWEKLDAVLDRLEEDEVFDFQNLDENGMPTKQFHASPPWVRRKWRIFMFAYWDPIVEHLPSIRSVLLASRWFILLVPCSLFVAASTWLTMSLIRNLEYIPGDCVIETLPLEFDIKNGITMMVTGRYTIRRFFEPSPERAGGMVIQQCNVAVECKNVNSGRGDTDGDDTCESFKMWAWKDPIECFYHRDDYFGENGRELYCLGRPSNLQQELFGTVVSGIGLMLTFLLVAIILYRRRATQRFKRDLERQAKEEKERDMADLQDRVKQEEEEARRQAERNAKENEVEYDDEHGDNHRKTNRSSTFIDIEAGNMRASVA